MQIEMLSRPKARRNDRAGDDIPLVIPGLLYGVFDGATDAYGSEVEGESVGRLAARTVAGFFTTAAAEGRLAGASAAGLIEEAAGRLAVLNTRHALRLPASTTVALAIDQGETFRLLVFGDSAIRVNGGRLFSRPKIIDEVSTAGRVAAYRLLANRLEGDAVEQAARRVIRLGFAQAAADGLLNTGEAEAIVEAVSSETRFRAFADDARRFLSSGIRTQFTHANNPASTLGYGSLNGSAPLVREAMEVVLPKAEVRTIELFTDGYFTMPTGTDLGAWEAEFARVEAADYHKIGAHPGVKGSTAAEFADDRTVISIALAHPA